MVGHELTKERDKSQRAVPLVSRDTNYRSRNGGVGGQEPSGRPYALPPTRSTTAGIGASRPSHQKRKKKKIRIEIEGHELTNDRDKCQRAIPLRSKGIEAARPNSLVSRDTNQPFEKRRGRRDRSRQAIPTPYQPRGRQTTG